MRLKFCDGPTNEQGDSRSRIYNIFVTSHQKKSADESTNLLENIHVFNETVHSSGHDGKPAEKKVGGQNIQTEQKGDSNKKETFNEAKFASVHEIGLDSMIPSRNLPNRFLLTNKLMKVPENISSPNTYWTLLNKVKWEIKPRKQPTKEKTIL